MDFHDFKNMTDYLQHLYQCVPYTHAGIEYPVTVYYPSGAQMLDVDSILDPYLPQAESKDYAIYDYSYLHNLQNSKPSLFNGRIFTLHFIRPKPLKIRGALGYYYDMLATCIALENELYAAIEDGWMLAPNRAQYHRHVTPQDAILRGDRRSAGIGISTLVVFNHAGTYKAMLAVRSNNTAFDSNMYHVLPAMMFQPSSPNFDNAAEWSIRLQVMREVLEELFNMPENRAPERWDFFYEHPAYVYLQDLMAQGKAHLYLSGLTLNLVTLRPEITTLLLIQEPEWFERITAADSDIPFLTTDETVKNSVVFAPIMTDVDFLAHFPQHFHLHMPPQASTAMWLAIELARKIIMGVPIVQTP